MNRELAKEKAMSRDCSCVKGKDRDNNYNSIIDEIFDWHESEVKKLSIHSVSNRRKLLIATIEKVRYSLDGYDALTSSQIAERLEKAINCC